MHLTNTHENRQRIEVQSFDFKSALENYIDQ